MIKEALQYIMDVSNADILSSHGQSYSTDPIHKLPGPEPSVQPLTVHSLKGIVDYIKCAKEHAAKHEDGIVLVSGPRDVAFVSPLYGRWEQRDVFVNAAPFVGKDFPFGRYLAVETFTVGLQTNFVQDENIAAILRLIGNVQSGVLNTVVDDGISQEVTVRKGITKVSNEVVASPVELRPFRTFQDVEQPSSKYVLRLNREGDEGMPEVALFEVDDKLWQLEAVRSIKNYLDDALDATLVLA